MLMLTEFKKNIKFFLLMALVLILLMSAGVSLFNFSFEINKRIYGTLEENFEYGYSVIVYDYIENDDAWKRNGVSYATYGSPYLSVAGLDDTALYSRAYQFENYLPKNFSKAINNFDDFVIAGNLWTAGDNSLQDGKYPIFLSDNSVALFEEEGREVSVGDAICLYTDFIIDGEQQQSSEIEFFVKGIYKKSIISYDYSVPDSVISAAAAAELSRDMHNSTNYTNFILNSTNDYKKFASYAKRQNLNYYAGIEDEISAVIMFSGIFIVISAILLGLCGLIAFVYCQMFINKRINFIGLLKALGMTDYKISKQFFILLLIIFAVAFLIANIFSVLITTHFATLALELFDFGINTGFNVLSQCVFAVLVVLTIFISVVLLNRRISKISVAQVLTQKE